MKLAQLNLPKYILEYYHQFTDLTPIQEKAIKADLLGGKSLLICAPTASGKTLIATMAMVNNLPKGKVIYLVPLKALANEKFKEYSRLLEGTKYQAIMSTSDIDSESSYLARYNVLILTTEKLDSLLRHKVSWIKEVNTVIIDEIHLLNDPTRGPTLEVIITLLKRMIQPQLIGLSATIGNPQELAQWLESDLVFDQWRPVKLKQGIRQNQKTVFYD